MPLTPPMISNRAYEVYLAWSNVADDTESLVDICAGMSLNSQAARLLGVDLYYRADHDTMLLGLRFDPHITTQALLDRVHEEAKRCGASVLEVARLPEEEKSRFRAEYLAQYPLKVLGLPTPSDAMNVLARDLGALAGPFDAGAAGSSPGGASRGGPPVLEVRYARGDGWQLGRARNLTREGIYIVAGATPRVGDIVEVSVAAGVHELLARGQVVYVTPEDAASALGAAGFGVRFHLGAVEDRQKLEKLVALTVGEGYASVRQAPARRDVRYPVRWPVQIDLGHAAATLRALDVSARGMFIGCSSTDVPAQVAVEVAIDDPGQPIRAQARVARAVTAQQAHHRRVATGFGLELTAFHPSDEARFRMFVQRIGRRAEKSVIVAASAERAADVATSLAAAGYAATSVSDPELVVEKALRARAPDLVLVDDSLERRSGEGVRSMRKALARRDVPICFVEPGVEPRSVVDAALLG